MQKTVKEHIVGSVSFPATIYSNCILVSFSRPLYGLPTDRFPLAVISFLHQIGYVAS